MKKLLTILSIITSTLVLANDTTGNQIPNQENNTTEMKNTDNSQIILLLEQLENAPKNKEKHLMEEIIKTDTYILNILIENIIKNFDNELHKFKIFSIMEKKYYDEFLEVSTMDKEELFMYNEKITKTTKNQVILDSEKKEEIKKIEYIDLTNVEVLISNKNKIELLNKIRELEDKKNLFNNKKFIIDNIPLIENIFIEIFNHKNKDLSHLILDILEESKYKSSIIEKSIFSFLKNDKLGNILLTVYEEGKNDLTIYKIYKSLTKEEQVKLENFFKSKNISFIDKNKSLDLERKKLQEIKDSNNRKNIEIATKEEIKNINEIKKKENEKVAEETITKIIEVEKIKKENLTENEIIISEFKNNVNVYENVLKAGSIKDKNFIPYLEQISLDKNIDLGTRKQAVFSLTRIGKDSLNSLQKANLDEDLKFIAKRGIDSLKFK